MNHFSLLGAKLKNIFSVSELKKRYEDGKIQVATAAGETFEKREAHPYGFKAIAKKGTVFIFCKGGNFDNYELLPVVDYEGPELQEGDAALYTESGGYIICRENGEVELDGKNYGGVIKVDELRTQLDKLTARVDGIMNALKNSATAAQDGGATYKAAIIVALNLLIDKENFFNIASNKVFHGNGS